ncbi:MAG: fasciclin domain-containing protein [Anaerolineaceae bacterium]|nr:MAG: fasciclin domain-containing protein [Anaerolineaceae bacterium]
MYEFGVYETMRKLLAFLMVMSLSVVAFGVAAYGDDDGEERGTIADLVVATAEEGEFTILLAAVLAADEAVLEALADPDGEFTVFAPTDAAFADLIEEMGEEEFNEALEDPEFLAEILFYHVVPGVAKSEDVLALLEASPEGFSVQTAQGQYVDVTADEDGVYVDDAALVLDMLDIMADNGVIHVIDTVIFPEFRTIAEIVVDAASDEDEPQFTLLLTAVLAADEAVLEALSDEEAALTVFAPVDAAFEALGDTLTAVLEDTELLTTILLYHALDGVVYSYDVVELLEANDGMFMVEMLDGSEAVVSVTEDGIFINEAQIVITDIEAYNGVIHVIDAVILPPMGE